MKFEDLESSVMTYINREFCKKLEDWRKWALPLVVRLRVPSLKQLFDSNIDMLKSSGFVMDDGTICIDGVYKYLSQISRDTGSIKCNIPMIGDVTFTSNDVDCLYSIMKQEATPVIATPIVQAPL